MTSQSDVIKRRIVRGPAAGTPTDVDNKWAPVPDVVHVHSLCIQLWGLGLESD